MAEKATDLFKYASQSHQELDSYFSIRRTNRKPLEENAVMVSYEALEKEMASPTSTIYKGQIVVTNGPKEGNAVPEDKDSRFFMPWLIKTDNDQAKDQFYADRVMTGSYTAYFLEQRYVTKYQLGTKYTGVGQWADVKGSDTEEGSKTYTEIFNDYVTNIAPIHEKDDKDMPYLSHAHIEGYGNYADHSYVHVEGSGNMAYARNVHVEGEQNSAYGTAAHAGGSHTLAKGNYSTTLGRESVAYGESSLAAGYKTIANEPYSVALGKATVTNGEGAVAMGVASYSNGLGSVAEGQGTYAKAGAAHAEGIKTVVTGEAGHAEGINSAANGRGSHAEGNAFTYVDATYAHAEGAASAYGTYSHAEGAGITYGNYSHVEGTSTIGAESTYSHAEGDSTIAPGKEYSHSEGQATVEGNYSHGEGTSTVTGDKSHGEGAGIVKGTYSHAEGNGQVEGHYAHAEGEGYVKGDYAHAEGQGQATGDYAHAEGTGVASKEFAHAEGSNTTASGQYSHAEGANTTASGTSSHAEGYFTTASNDYAHAEGNNTKADGLASHVEGNENEITSTGHYAHVEGKSNLAKGEYSHIEGQSNEANANYVHIEGQSNIATNTATASHIEGLENNVSGEYAHAEGKNTYISEAATYSHGEGYGGSAYGVASHVEGFMSHARGTYSHASGFCTIAPNSGEFSGGTYNRAYTTNVQLSDGVDITTVPNEFARLGGRYIAGRYPTGIAAYNASTVVAKYDDSYETVFTIGNGSYDNQSLAIGPLEYIKETQDGKEVSYDAGQYVKKYSRHNIMDIRKNGQMYYDGGMIVGGEIVAPMSYSYVASLGPTAYFTTIMAALLTQPEYYRPYLKKTFTGSSQYNSNFSYAYNGFMVVEVGSTVSLGVFFTGYRLSYDSLNHLDPIYGTVLGNMLGYSTGITNITYRVCPGSASLSASQNNATFSTTTYQRSKDYAIYTNSSAVDIPPANSTTEEAKKNYINSHKCGFTGNLAADINIGRNLGEGKWDYFAYQGGDNNSIKSTDTTQIVTNFKIGTEDTYTLLRTISYEYAPASQMYFQQLAEKGTYIGAAGTKPLEKWNRTEKFSYVSDMNIKSIYVYYYGVSSKSILEIQKEHDTSTAANKGWDALVNNTAGYNLARYSGYFDYNWGVNGNKEVGSNLQKAQDGAKTLWVAVPACMFALKGRATNAKGYPIFFQYTNKTGTVELDTGITVHDELIGKNEYGGSTPLYSFLTHTKIGNCKLQYRVFAVCNAGGIAVDKSGSSVNWRCTLTRKIARTPDKDMTQFDTPLAQYLYTVNNGNASQDKYTK